MKQNLTFKSQLNYEVPRGCSDTTQKKETVVFWALEQSLFFLQRKIKNFLDTSQLAGTLMLLRRSTSKVIIQSIRVNKITWD